MGEIKREVAWACNFNRAVSKAIKKGVIIMTNKPLLFLGIFFVAIGIAKLGFVLISRVKETNAVKEEAK